MIRGDSYHALGKGLGLSVPLGPFVGLAVRLGRLADGGDGRAHLVGLRFGADPGDGGAVGLLAELREDRLAVAGAVAVDAQGVEIIFVLREEDVDDVCAAVLLGDGLVGRLGVERVEATCGGRLLVHRLESPNRHGGELASGEPVVGNQVGVELAVGGVVADHLAESREGVAILLDGAENELQRLAELRSEQVGLLFGSGNEGAVGGILHLPVGQMLNTRDLGGGGGVPAIDAHLGDHHDVRHHCLDSLGDDRVGVIVAHPARHAGDLAERVLERGLNSRLAAIAPTARLAVALQLFELGFGVADSLGELGDFVVVWLHL